jgi:predicted transcriptional regulator
LKKLVDKEVVTRRQISLEQGGYIYVYSIKNRKVIREKINNLLKEWSTKVEKELNSWCTK